MQSDPPSLSSLSVSSELARVRKLRPSSSSTLTNLLSELSPPSSRDRSTAATRTDTLSNVSLSIGGSDDDASFDEGDELGDTVDLASQSEMPSLSLRAANTRAVSEAPFSTISVLPLTPFDFGSLSDGSLTDALGKLWGGEVLDLRAELLSARQALHTELEATISAYLDEKSSLNELHDHLAASEAELRRCSALIGEQTTTLRSLVDDLRKMHVQTRQDVLRRDHRREVERPLSAFVEDVIVPPNVERALREAKIDAVYVAYVQAFLEKLSGLGRHTEFDGGAFEETKAQVRSLLTFVTARSHRWLVKRLSVICDSISQWQQRQSALLKYKVLVSLLREHDKPRSEDVINRYVASATGLFTQHYTALLEAVAQCRDHSSSNDLLGQSDYSIFSFFGARYSLQRPNLFSLETRQKTLHQLDHAIELPQSGSLLPEGSSFEYWFRGIHFELVTLIMKEHRFTLELFHQDLTLPIFSALTHLFLTSVRNFASSTYDVLSLVVLAVVLAKHHEMMTLRIPRSSFSQYFSEMLLILKNHILNLLDQHARSLDTADARSLRDVDPRAPHYVTRRFAELHSSLLALHSAYAVELDHLGLEESSARLGKSGLELIFRLADSIDTQTLRSIFLINNLDIIFSVLLKRGCSSSSIKFFNDKLDEAINALVSHYIQLKFPELSVLKASGGKWESASSLESLMEAVARWKRAAEQIYSELQKNVANLDIGFQVLTKVLEVVTTIYASVHDQAIEQKVVDVTQLREYVPPNELRYAVRRFLEQSGTETK